jgi:membrane protein
MSYLDNWLFAPYTAWMIWVRRLRQIVGGMLAGFWEDDGFILSGHLAYLSLLALFPFFIFIVWLAGRFGRTAEGVAAITAFLESVPINVAAALREPIAQVTGQQSQGLLTIGILVALWTAGSVIETIRVVIHKAYNVPTGRPFWQYRLQSFVMVIGSALILLAAMSAQFGLAGLEKLMHETLPRANQMVSAFDYLRQWMTPVLLFLALIGLHRALTPRRVEPTLHWPGALFTALSWIGIAAALPQVLSHFSTYDITYGSLAGVMITLLFFYLIGAAFVLGSQLNAAFRQAMSTLDSPATIA